MRASSSSTRKSGNASGKAHREGLRIASGHSSAPVRRRAADPYSYVDALQGAIDSSDLFSPHAGRTPKIADGAPAPRRFGEERSSSARATRAPPCFSSQKGRSGSRSVALDAESETRCARAGRPSASSAC
jgi:hypothetical protein